MNLEISKVLVCSTGHLAKDEANPVDPSELYGRDVLRSEAAFAVTCLTADEMGDDEAWPPEEASTGLKAVVDLARAQGCDRILFDSDAPAIEGLPVYVW